MAEEGENLRWLRRFLTNDGTCRGGGGLLVGGVTNPPPLLASCPTIALQGVLISFFAQEENILISLNSRKKGFLFCLSSKNGFQRSFSLQRAQKMSLLDEVWFLGLRKWGIPFGYSSACSIKSSSF